MECCVSLNTIYKTPFLICTNCGVCQLKPMEYDSTSKRVKTRIPIFNSQLLNECEVEDLTQIYKSLTNCNSYKGSYRRAYLYASLVLYFREYPISTLEFIFSSLV